MSKWMRHSNGNIVLVLDDAHIARVLSEGGQEVSGPDAAPEPLPPARSLEEQHAVEEALRARNEQLSAEVEALRARIEADFHAAPENAPRTPRKR